MIELWKEEAACRKLKMTSSERAEFMHPLSRRKDAISKVKAVCEDCPVRKECLEYALETNQRKGVWGGTSERQRLELLRTR
jgi:WhiB family redox-sensing transcriptional regulator